MTGGDTHKLTERVRRLVATSAFQWSVLGVIIAAGVVVGLETSPSLMERYGDLLHLADRIILWLFVVEAALKMFQHGAKWHRYFRDPWNIFDFTIIVVCFLPLHGEFAAVLRLARVLRAARLVSAVPSLQLLVGSLLRSLPSMVWVGLLLLLLFYIYAVLGVFLFRGNDPTHFSDLGTAMLTLFRVATLEDWTDVMYIQMYGSDRYAGYVNQTDLPRTSEARPMIAIGFFVSFVLLGTMIMLNLFIGVIINSMDEAKADAEQQRREQHIAETGRATLSDDLTALERDLEAIQLRILALRRRAEKMGDGGQDQQND